MRHAPIICSLFILLACKGPELPDPVPDPVPEDYAGTYQGRVIYGKSYWADSTYTDSVGQPVFWWVPRAEHDTFATTIELVALGPDSLMFLPGDSLAPALAGFSTRFAWVGIDTTYQEWWSCYDCSNGYRIYFGADGDSLYFWRDNSSWGQMPYENHSEGYRFAGAR